MGWWDFVRVAWKSSNVFMACLARTWNIPKSKYGNTPGTTQETAGNTPGTTGNTPGTAGNTRGILEHLPACNDVFFCSQNIQICSGKGFARVGSKLCCRNSMGRGAAFISKRRRHYIQWTLFVCKIACYSLCWGLPLGGFLSKTCVGYAAGMSCWQCSWASAWRGRWRSWQWAVLKWTVFCALGGRRRWEDHGRLLQPMGKTSKIVAWSCRWWGWWLWSGMSWAYERECWGQALKV